MAENDYTTIKSVQSLSNLTVSNTNGGQDQNKRKNTRKGLQTSTTAQDCGPADPVSDTIGGDLSERESDGQHLDCRI